MNTDYATAIDTTICALDPVNTLKLAANQSGMMHFPLKGRTVVDPLLTPHLLREPGVQEHWMRQYGLGVSACVSADCATWWLMSSRSATCSKYENAFQEALADAVWVATHARVAREAMRAAVRDAAFVMEIMWEIAMRQDRRCFLAVTILASPTVDSSLMRH
jgi:hypothetical protein